MTRSTAPDQLWAELRRAACAHLQAKLEHERKARFFVSDDALDIAWKWLADASRAESAAIKAIVVAEQSGNHE